MKPLPTEHIEKLILDMRQWNRAIAYDDIADALEELLELRQKEKSAEPTNQKNI